MGDCAVSLAILTILMAVVQLFIYRKQAGRRKVSRIAQYQGYSEAIYDGYERRSQYLTLDDGTRLAYDLLLPAKDGVPVEGRPPHFVGRASDGVCLDRESRWPKE